MPTFQITLLGNIFRPGTLVSATLRIVARDQADADSIADQYAEALRINGSTVVVDGVYEMSETVKPRG